MNRSETISNLAKALTGFNAEVSKISKDANNPFFENKYSTLDTIVEEIRPILQKHGLNILQMPSGDGEKVALTTMLLHDSGEYIESEQLLMKPVKNDPQAVGSCITYARRYSLASFLSLNTGEDDDGNLATHSKDKPVQIVKISQEQIKTLNDLITQTKTDINALVNSYKIKSINDMTEAQYSNALKVLKTKLEKS